MQIPRAVGLGCIDQRQARRILLVQHRVRKRARCMPHALKRLCRERNHATHVLGFAGVALIKSNVSVA